MEGVIDSIMHSDNKKIFPSKDTPVELFELYPKEVEVRYSKIWVVLDHSDAVNPDWLEIERPMIPRCEWVRDNENLQIQSGQRIRVTMEIINDD